MATEPKVTRGEASKVPCPYCALAQDLAQFSEVLDSGTEMECDGCGERYVVKSVQQLVIVTLAPK